MEQVSIFDDVGRVYLMRLNVVLGDDPEIFVAASGAGGAYGFDWGVYTPLEDGSYRPVGFITFHYDAFYYSASDSLFSIYVRLSGSLGGYSHFRVNANGFELLPDEPNDAVDIQRVAEWKRTGRPPLYWAELASLLSAGPVEWRDFETNEVVPLGERLDMPVTR